MAAVLAFRKTRNIHKNNHVTRDFRGMMPISHGYEKSGKNVRDLKAHVQKSIIIINLLIYYYCCYCNLLLLLLLSMGVESFTEGDCVTINLRNVVFLILILVGAYSVLLSI